MWQFKGSWCLSSWQVYHLPFVYIHTELFLYILSAQTLSSLPGGLCELLRSLHVHSLKNDEVLLLKDSHRQAELKDAEPQVGDRPWAESRAVSGEKREGGIADYKTGIDQVILHSSHTADRQHNNSVPDYSCNTRLPVLLALLTLQNSYNFNLQSQELAHYLCVLFKMITGHDQCESFRFYLPVG